MLGWTAEAQRAVDAYIACNTTCAFVNTFLAFKLENSLGFKFARAVVGLWYFAVASAGDPCFTPFERFARFSDTGGESKIPSPTYVTVSKIPSVWVIIIVPVQG